MCQLNVILERDGKSEPIMESVTALEVTPEAIVISTFFEEPVSVKNAHISRIDFLGGTVVLVPTDNLQNNRNKQKEEHE